MSEAAPHLSVDSATGIDVTLPIAGAGARAYAFVVDWHIRLVLGLAWYGAAALLYNYLREGAVSVAPPVTNEARWFGAVFIVFGVFLVSLSGAKKKTLSTED